MVPLVGVEPTCLAAHDFESCVSANSTTAAPAIRDTSLFLRLILCLYRAILSLPGSPYFTKNFLNGKEPGQEPGICQIPGRKAQQPAR